MDPVQELRRIEAPVSEEEEAAAQARTLAALREHYRSARPARRRRRVIVAVAAAGALALAPLGVLGLRGGADPEPASAATRFLRDVADRAAARGDVVLGAGQFYAVRGAERFSPDRSTYEARTWRNGEGRGVRHWLKDGRIEQRRSLVPGGEHWAAEGLSYDEILALPTDHDALARRIREMATAEPMRAPEGSASRAIVLTALGILRFNRPVPAKLRAALFEVMAATPGVRYVGAVRDPLGRAGVAVAIDGDEAHEFYGREAIIDPRTSELLATVEYRYGDLRRVTGESVRQEAVVDAEGTVPDAWRRGL